MRNEEMENEEILENDIQEEVVEMSNWDHIKGIHGNNKKWIKKNGKKIVIGIGAAFVALGLAAAIFTGNDPSTIANADDNNKDFDPTKPMDIDFGDTNINVESETIVTDDVTVE